MAERDEFESADLRHQWQSGSRPSDAHLGDAMWERLSCEDLSPVERDRALAHVTSCQECGSIYRGLLEMRREAAALNLAAATVTIPARVRATRAWWYSPWFAGSMGVAALILWTVTIGPMRPVTDYSNDVTRTPRPAVTLLSPADGATFNRELAWQAVEGATSYRVAAFTVEGARAFDVRDLTGTSLTLAPEIVLVPGRYFLQITALRGAETIAESPLVPVVVR
jgi:hypothetical protein